MVFICSPGHWLLWTKVSLPQVTVDSEVQVAKVVTEWEATRLQVILVLLLLIFLILLLLFLLLQVDLSTPDTGRPDHTFSISGFLPQVSKILELLAIIPSTSPPLTLCPERVLSDLREEGGPTGGQAPLPGDPPGEASCWHIP